MQNTGILKKLLIDNMKHSPHVAGPLIYNKHTDNSKSLNINYMLNNWRRQEINCQSKYLKIVFKLQFSLLI